jgi:hypothetical protein
LNFDHSLNFLKYDVEGRRDIDDDIRQLEDFGENLNKEARNDERGAVVFPAAHSLLFSLFCPAILCGLPVPTVTKNQNGRLWPSPIPSPRFTHTSTSFHTIRQNYSQP